MPDIFYSYFRSDAGLFKVKKTAAKGDRHRMRTIVCV